jgi:hypothetical protein
MVNVSRSFTTRAEAEAWVAAYLADYHPCGYGTRLTITPTQDGTFLVTGSRFHSCD